MVNKRGLPDTGPGNDGNDVRRMTLDVVCQAVIWSAGYGTDISFPASPDNPMSNLGNLVHLAIYMSFGCTHGPIFDTIVPVQKLFRSGREYYSLKVISTPARGFYARLQLKRRP
jgi:hypothetical protein